MEGDATGLGKIKPGFRSDGPKDDLLKKDQLIGTALLKQRSDSDRVKPEVSISNDVARYLQNEKFLQAQKTPEEIRTWADVWHVFQEQNDLQRLSLPYLRKCLSPNRVGRISRTHKVKLNAAVIQMKARKMKKLSVSQGEKRCPQHLHEEARNSASSNSTCHKVRSILPVTVITSALKEDQKRSNLLVQPLSQIGTRSCIPKYGMPDHFWNHPLLKSYGVVNFNSDLNKLRSVFDLDLELITTELEECLDNEWMTETQAGSVEASPISQGHVCVFIPTESIFSL
jgi:hypothetical protein